MNLDRYWYLYALILLWYRKWKCSVQTPQIFLTFWPSFLMIIISNNTFSCLYRTIIFDFRQYLATLTLWRSTVCIQIRVDKRGVTFVTEVLHYWRACGNWWTIATGGGNRLTSFTLKMFRQPLGSANANNKMPPSASLYYHAHLKCLDAVKWLHLLPELLGNLPMKKINISKVNIKLDCYEQTKVICSTFNLSSELFLFQMRANPPLVDKSCKWPFPTHVTLSPWTRSK